MVVFNVISPLFKGYPDKGEKSSVPMGTMRRGPTVILFLIDSLLLINLIE